MFSIFFKKTPISKLEEGKGALIEGEVVAREELSLSGSGTKCVYYDKMNESFEHGQRGRGRRMWVPTNMEKRSAGFFVKDESGRVWVVGDTDALDVQGGKRESGTIGKGNRKRYLAQMVQNGDKVRVKGLVSKPKGSEPADSLVIRPGAKGRLTVRVH
jgi:hypothetical protein